MRNFSIFKSGKGRNLKLPQLIDMAAQIAAGMAFLGMMVYSTFFFFCRNTIIFVNLIFFFFVVKYFRVAKLYSS